MQCISQRQASNERFTAHAALLYIGSMKKLQLISIALLLVACSSAPARQHTIQYNISDDQMNELVMYAVSLADTPYHYGGNSANSGFDCSGFVGHVYRHSLDISMPRTSREISRIGKTVSQSELSPGDLVFYHTSHASFSHVGIYVGDGKFVHSPRTGESVRTEQMQMSYWAKRYDGARRIRR
jgi:cell wall-associated NlpC family hydrolase